MGIGHGSAPRRNGESGGPGGYLAEASDAKVAPDGGGPDARLLWGRFRKAPNTKAFYRALEGQTGPVARVLVRAPEHRHTMARLQIAAENPYSEIREAREAPRNARDLAIASLTPLMIKLGITLV